MSHDDFVADVVIPNHADVLCVEFSADSTVLCAGTSDSTILQLFSQRLFKASSTVINSTMSAGEDLKAPPVCIRFLPEAVRHGGGDSDHQAKNLMLVACVDGGLSQWHLSSGRRIQSARYLDNPMYALDYTPASGDAIAAGCDDGLVRILDSHKISTVIETLRLATDIDWVPNGSQRIQSIKHMDAHLIATGGWGRTVHIWDRRSGTSVSRIYGPYICGDGLDVNGTTMVTASYREDDPLQLWDLRNLSEPTSRSLVVPPVNSSTAVDAAASRRASSLTAAKANPHRNPPTPQQEQLTPDAQSNEQDADRVIQKPCLFTAKFCPNGTRVLAGGNYGQLHYFNVATGEEIVAESKDAFRSKGLASAALLTQSHSIFSLAWSPDGRSVGIGGGHGLCLGVTV